MLTFRFTPVAPTTALDEDTEEVQVADWKLLRVILVDEALIVFVVPEYRSISMFEITRTL